MRETNQATFSADKLISARSINSEGGRRPLKKRVTRTALPPTSATRGLTWKPDQSYYNLYISIFEFEYCFYMQHTMKHERSLKIFEQTHTHTHTHSHTHSHTHRHTDTHTQPHTQTHTHSHTHTHTQTHTLTHRHTHSHRQGNITFLWGYLAASSFVHRWQCWTTSSVSSQSNFSLAGSGTISAG